MNDHVATMDVNNFWSACLGQLEADLSPQQFNTWIRTLAVSADDENWLLLVPNRFMLQFIKERFFDRIDAIRVELAPTSPELLLRVNAPQTQSSKTATNTIAQKNNKTQDKADIKKNQPRPTQEPTLGNLPKRSLEKARLNPIYTFDNLVTGKGNQLAHAAALQIAENPGDSTYNPMFIYGCTGLGKTHLIQAIGNKIHQLKPDANIRYIHAERYVADIMKAFREKAFDEFKRYYHSLDLLLIDDIQFFAGKNRTMEEFFYAFNALLDSKKQVVITCDTYPSQIDGMDDRLKSRFSWGLTVEIQPPELEMRVAILLKKAMAENVKLDNDAAFFIAQNIRSNVRELEGAFKRALAVSRFQSKPITLELAKEALKDILAVVQRQITIEGIQKTVADYYRIKVSDLLGKKRTRNITRPRQLAMALAKELTTQSLPMIGNAFGGRDHTTVMHACKTIADLKQTDPNIAQDFDTLVSILRD
ncbi:chromosomal replication initiator protein DnaA [Neisseria sp. Ec49-e6-T10]|uniref:chromosomal replication initiator protein DnaA n=1 Tax=Neisseria sp. Ec49-e6-T10 TaxID=3140744 RepID=UPI003EB75430